MAISTGEYMAPTTVSQSSQPPHPTTNTLISFRHELSEIGQAKLSTQRESLADYLKEQRMLAQENVNSF